MAGETPKGRRLLETSMCVVHARGRIAECRIIARPDETHEEGAHTARQLSELLVGKVLAENGTFDALLLDLREGPTAFGPKTRQTLEEWMTLAELRRKRVAILVGESATQRLQFRSVAANQAPTCAKVFSEEVDAWAWAKGS